MFVIKYKNMYWHNKQRIILFESPEQAEIYKQHFANAAVQKMGMDPFAQMQLSSFIAQSFTIAADFDMEKDKNVQTIWLYELEN